MLTISVESLEMMGRETDYPLLPTPELGSPIFTSIHPPIHPA